MKFGKEFRIHLEDTLPDWRDKFLCYKPLKKLLKNIPLQNHDAPLDVRTGVVENVDVEVCFVRILEDQLEKFNDFYVDKEEEFIIRLQELKERIESVKSRSSNSGAFTSVSENEFSDEIFQIRKAFVTIHGEMVLLKNYSSLNFAGIVKILKKYDKRTGGLLRLPFTQRVLHQPFFTTEPLTWLVQECEANLELIFPLEAEVIESSPQRHSSSTAPITHDNLSESISMDVYRSTLAAMRAIQGLRRASSTSNPLSLGQFFLGANGEDTAGAVTSENSDCNSSETSHTQENHQDCANSSD